MAQAQSHWMVDPEELGNGAPGARNAAGENEEPEPSLTCTAPDTEAKGTAEDTESALARPSECYLISLPTELINCILLYLPPIDLLAVSATCRTLYSIATSDHLWQALIQENVPGIHVTKPYPFGSFRELYAAHDPRWFLPKYKIWFSDVPGLIGRLAIVRYDQRRGCIEGYQLVTSNTNSTERAWDADPTVTIRNFDPRHILHLDRPVLHLEALQPEKIAEEEQTARPLTVINLRRVDKLPRVHGPDEQRGNRFRSAVPMELGASDATRSHFMHAQALGREVADPIAATPFPYSGVWPPPAFPAPHRVTGANPYGEEEWPRGDDDPPRRRADVSDRCFRIRTFFHEMSLTVMNFLARAIEDPIPLRLGGQLATYSTLDPHLYTPTREKPYRGIWVGDYSVHGCEYVFIHQPDDDPADRFDPSSLIQGEEESDEAFSQRKTDATVYRGRLEAVKLTGDPHVPRGEVTFSVDDLGEGGFLGVLNDEPFRGTRMVRSKGHVAEQGFIQDGFLTSRLFLISHDCLAQYWERFRHISYFRRVDIEQFLAPP